MISTTKICCENHRKDSQGNRDGWKGWNRPSKKKKKQRRGTDFPSSCTPSTTPATTSTARTASRRPSTRRSSSTTRPAAPTCASSAAIWTPSPPICPTNSSVRWPSCATASSPPERYRSVESEENLLASLSNLTVVENSVRLGRVWWKPTENESNLWKPLENRSHPNTIGPEPVSEPFDRHSRLRRTSRNQSDPIGMKRDRDRFLNRSALICVSRRRRRGRPTRRRPTRTRRWAVWSGGPTANASTTSSSRAAAARGAR